MATPTLEDAVLLNQMFQQAMSPLDRLGQGRLTIATEQARQANTLANQKELYNQLGQQEMQRTRAQALFNEANRAGVEYFDKDGRPRPFADVQKDIFGAYKSSATSSLSRLDEMLKVRRDDASRIANQMVRVAISGAGPEAVAQAAKALAADTAITKQLRPEELRKLSSGKATETEINAIYERLSRGWWGVSDKGARFLSAFNGALEPLTKESDQAILDGLKLQLLAMHQEAGDIVKRRDDFILQNSRWLPEAKLRPEAPEAGSSETQGTPQEKLDAFIKEQAPTLAQPPSEQPASQEFSGVLPMALGPVTRAAGAAIGNTARDVGLMAGNTATALMGGNFRAADSSGPAPIAFTGLQPIAGAQPWVAPETALAQAAQPITPDMVQRAKTMRAQGVTGPFSAEQLQGMAIQITPGQVTKLGNAVQSVPIPAGSASGAPGGPPTPSEIQQLKMVAMRPPFSLTPQQVDAAAQRVTQGDPQALYQFNEMLKGIRTANLGLSIPGSP